ncbi:hypothetical protein GpartN1_g4588.t1 [Galdieria partita]|uniref:Phosphatidic acid phosphatase type 2/haloperoxidase domain-containing protein n=1 Tax=Galdieria partita TaxID=83374 RepID=A0A9C7PZM1_9RHOD|nr:hypothetical protein GpartN1_g4588.t1 [Galdieria partita]
MQDKNLLEDFSCFYGLLFHSFAFMCDLWLLSSQYALFDIVGKLFLSQRTVRCGTWLKKRDKQLSKKVFDFVHKHFWMKAFLTLCSFSCDGSVWFTIPFVPVLCHLYKSPQESATFSRWKATLFSVDFALFCFVVLCCCTLSAVLELSLKVVVRRKRPSFNNKSSFVIPAEKWSFPSGHTMRAFTICSYVSFRIPWLRSWFPILRSELASILFVCCLCTWACLVAISRIGRGRHFALDCYAASVCGRVTSLVLLTPIVDRFLSSSFFIFVSKLRTR